MKHSKNMSKTIILVITSFIINLSSNHLSVLCQYQCVKAHKDSKVLILEHNYDFRSNASDWNIVDEVKAHKLGYLVHFITSKHNVQVLSDFLVLNAGRKKGYVDYNIFRPYVNFSGAMITFEDALGETGRLEIRARLPEGAYLRTRISADISSQNVSSSTNRTLSTDKLNLLTYNSNQTNLLARGIRYKNKSTPYQSENFLNFRNPQDFHIFGIERDFTGLQFFVDQEYSRELKFKKQVLSWISSLSLQLGVGGPGIKVPDDATGRRMLRNELEWNCPALIVDYVRIYVPYINNEFNDSGEEKCLTETIDKTPRSVENEMKAVDAICKRYKISAEEKKVESPKVSNTTSNSTELVTSSKAPIVGSINQFIVIILIIAAIFLILLPASFYISYRIYRVIRNENLKLETENDENNMLNNIYDRSNSEGEYYEIIDDETRFGSREQSVRDRFYLQMLPNDGERRPQGDHPYLQILPTGSENQYQRDPSVLRYSDIFPTGSEIPKLNDPVEN